MALEKATGRLIDLMKKAGATDDPNKAKELGVKPLPIVPQQQMDAPKDWPKGYARGGAVQKFSRGGMVKAGSPAVSAKCSDTKTIKC